MRSLIDALAGAELVVVDDRERLAFAWFGGDGVYVYDEDGNDVDYVDVQSRGRRPSPHAARVAIDRVRASLEA